MYGFFSILAESGVVTTEQAASGLADQTWNKPASWILGFFLALATGAVIILALRALKKGDLNEQLLRKANDDRVKIGEERHRDSIQTLTDYKSLSVQMLGELHSIKSMVQSLRDEFLKFIYRKGPHD